MARKTPEEIVQSFKEVFGDNIIDAKIRVREIGRKKHKNVRIWLHVKRDAFKSAVYHLKNFEEFPHLSVISGTDIGDHIQLLYHFAVYCEEPLATIPITIVVDVPKSDPRIPTLAELSPWAVLSEREKMEMLGVIVEDIPDTRHVFLPENFPEGVYPWRRDEKGVPDEMLKKLYKEGRE